MNWTPVDPQILNLLRDLRPFLSPQAGAATELAETCVELLTSEGGQRAIHSFGRLMGSGDLQTAGGKPAANPFMLFLVLILLLLSFSPEHEPESDNPKVLPAGRSGY
ncbi:MAG: hypothetical protein QHH27_06945 [Clostridia bacterium]|jgi:hypothetical protein|nr:hypothetical protein [Clostridia bacterium]MDH7573266.1 hypothetical protein [Clostridia bacterium]